MTGVSLRQALEELEQPALPDELPHRVALCRQVLSLLSRQEAPVLWARLQYTLGSLLIELLAGHPGADLAEAIGGFRRALAVLTPAQAPDDWAHAMNAVALAYRQQRRGDQAQNLERALRVCRRTLTALRPESAPTLWATTMLNLGDVYSERVRGARPENLERAIECYSKALEVPLRQIMPDEWAQALLKLGQVYQSRVRGRREDNLEEAISCYEQALEVFTRDRAPDDWATAKLNLGAAYTDRLRGDRADNLERAIAAYREALTVFTRESAAADWALTMSNCANAYALRIRAERAENLEQAITAYEQALEVRADRTMAVEWAETMANLANVYADRLLGDREQNLDRAAQYYERALRRIRNRDAGGRRARWSTNLATIYTERAAGDRADNLERALGLLRRALGTPRRETTRTDRANALHVLASVFLDRVRGDPAKNIEHALAAGRRALAVRTRQAMPAEWAETTVNVAAAYRFRIPGDRVRNDRQAVAAYRRALRVYTPGALPAQHRRTQTGLGDLLFERRRWTQAYAAYRSALDVGDSLYLSSATPEARQAELRENRDLAPRAAYCLAQGGHLADAVATLEHGRARALSEALARSEATLQQASPAERDAFVAARERIAALEAEARGRRRPGTRDFLAVSSDLRVAREELAAVAGRIRASLPDFLPERLQSAEIARLADELAQPLVYLLTTPHGSLALLVLPGTPTFADGQALWLDEFRSDDLQAILYDREGESRYLRAVSGDDTGSLMDVLADLWPLLDERLMTPVARQVRGLGYERAVLLPAGLLALLPLHAVGAAPVTFSGAPSARALQTACRERAQRATSEPSLLGIANPAPHPRPLRFAAGEVAQIASLFPARAQQTLYDRQATRASLLRALPSATYLHLACHGALDLDAPLDSAIELAAGDTLTLRRLLDGGLDFSAIRLAVLSACQTGITDFRTVPDEAVGFPAAFLQARVPGIVSTLWPVDDASTAVLLVRFYRHHLVDGLDPAAALHSAQLWLRGATAGEMGLAEHWQKIYDASGGRDVDALRALRHWRGHSCERPFTHPYYWAAFSFSGV